MEPSGKVGEEFPQDGYCFREGPVAPSTTKHRRPVPWQASPAQLLLPPPCHFLNQTDFEGAIIFAAPPYPLIRLCYRKPMLQQLVAQRGIYGRPPPSAPRSPCEGGSRAPQDLPAGRPTAPRAAHGPRASGGFSGLPQERHQRALLAGSSSGSHRQRRAHSGYSPPRPSASSRSSARSSAGCCVPPGPSPACYLLPKSAPTGCTPSRPGATVAQGGTTAGCPQQAPEDSACTTSTRPGTLRGGAGRAGHLG